MKRGLAKVTAPPKLYAAKLAEIDDLMSAYMEDEEASASQQAPAPLAPAVAPSNLMDYEDYVE